MGGMAVRDGSLRLAGAEALQGTDVAIFEIRDLASS